MAWRLRESTGVFVAGQLLHGPVADALVEHAAAAKAGVIVLTTHGRGPLSRFWLGSVADKLIRAAPLPLLIHRPTEGAPSDLGADCRFHRILVPLDQTELGEQALAAATELARLFEAEITLLHVIVPVPVLAPDGVTYLPLSLGQAAFDATTKRARADLDDAAERLRGLGLIATARVVVDGQPASAILKEAESADLIVLATHGRGRVARFFLGSVADKVVRAAPCPVFIARSHSSAGGKT
jgi:nucleotide-binding universal stress UspA family protein